MGIGPLRRGAPAEINYTPPVNGMSIPQTNFFEGLWETGGELLFDSLLPPVLHSLL
jgi:hypothetical protein